MKTPERHEMKQQLSSTLYYKTLNKKKEKSSQTCQMLIYKAHKSPTCF